MIKVNSFYTSDRRSDNPTGTKRTPTQDETMTKQFRNNYETIASPAVAYQMYNPLANPPREIKTVLSIKYMKSYKVDVGRHTGVTQSGPR